MRPAARFVLPILLWLLAACGGGDSPTAPPLPPPNPDRDGDGILNTVDACPDQPETFNGVFDTDGCPDTLQQFYEVVRADVEAFWGAEFTASQLTYTLITVFQGYSAPFTSPCGVLPLGNAFYCPANAGVYYDNNLLATFLNQIGDMAPAFIIGHEIGHHVSWILGWTLVISTKQNELQADCLAGAWTKSANDRGLLEQGDLEEAVGALLLVADPDFTWFDPTAHGTADQRVFAFAAGFAGGSSTCTSQEFVDLFPLLQSVELNSSMMRDLLDNDFPRLTPPPAEVRP